MIKPEWREGTIFYKIEGVKTFHELWCHQCGDSCSQTKPAKYWLNGICIDDKKRERCENVLKKSGKV